MLGEFLLSCGYDLAVGAKQDRPAGGGALVDGKD
jgi:hypothetical protein